MTSFNQLSSSTPTPTNFVLPFEIAPHTAPVKVKLEFPRFTCVEPFCSPIRLPSPFCTSYITVPKSISN